MIIQGWYQIDFKLPKKREKIKKTVLRIDQLMTNLKSDDLLSAWFFLYEGRTIRIRMYSEFPTFLEFAINERTKEYKLKISDVIPFSPYQEDDSMMSCEPFAHIFAYTMTWITRASIAKIRGDFTFDSYRALERIHHCIYNNIAGLSGKSEESYLVLRLAERMRSPAQKDFEGGD